MFKKILYGVGGVVILIVIFSTIGYKDNKTGPKDIFSLQEAIVTGPFSTNTPVSGEQPVPGQEENVTYYRVIKVVDGDTIAVDMDGKTETIRLIGINTPETVDPRKQVECFGREASDKAKELLSGKRVRVETDATQGERDKYGRLLAYIYLEDGLFFNKHMIEEGYAYEYTYNLPYKYQAEFRAAQQSAQAGEKGLWTKGVCDSRSTATPSPSIPASVSSDYSCAEDTYNCGGFKTHAEAQSAYEACGGTGNDIHHLDQDGDGLACESLP